MSTIKDTHLGQYFFLKYLAYKIIIEFTITQINLF